ncbi:MAG: M23 family metallopeptidase, partial [Alphaproteobacteria bacterium]|nr:M23 family metallopeptidase [Alphaproteobacteria bacterium]
ISVVAGAMAGYCRRLFAERQLIVREQSGVVVIRLSAIKQLLLLTLLLSSVLISSYTVVGFFSKGSDKQRNRLILQAANEKLSITTEQNLRDRQELEATRETLTYYRLFTNRLVTNKRELADSHQLGTQLSAQLRSSADAIVKAEEEINRVLVTLKGERPQATVAELLSAENSMKSAAPSTSASNWLVEAGFTPATPGASAAEGSVETLVQGSSLQQMVDGLRQELQLANRRNSELQATLNTSTAAFSQVMVEKRNSLAMVDGLKAKAVQAEQKVKELQAQQNAEVVRLTATTNRVVGNLERLLRATGMNIREVIPLEKQKGASNSGGPFVSWKGEGLAQSGSTGRLRDEQVRANLNRSLEKLASLSKVFYQIPFSHPLVSYSVTSQFGPRVDPFNGRMAMHEGLDMGVQIGTAVRSTAPGVVIFAGERGAYGNMVEIVHGNGISTRYAHMSKVMVRIGQRVGLHETVGISGSSGRSQGPHLHYEVRVNGIARNPVNFLKAKSNVQEQ